jgi:hypothetical protein
MALIGCPDCKKKISDSANNCPFCGYPLTPETVAKLKHQEQKKKRDTGIGCFFILAAILFGSFLASLTSPKKTTTSTESTNSAPSLSEVMQPVITGAKFKALKTGISYKQAVALIGSEGKEMGRVDIPGAPLTITYVWQNPTGSNATLMFQGDRLTVKSQFGLE